MVKISNVLNDTRRRQIGINTCFLTDDDTSYLRKPKRPFGDSLKELRPKYPRYPGGMSSIGKSATSPGCPWRKAARHQPYPLKSMLKTW
jgi:hypothetical protein